MTTSNAIAEVQSRSAVAHSGVKISSMELTTMDDIYRLAQTFAASGITPKTYGNNADKVFVGIIAGAEVGFAPMQALQSIAVINGMPSIWGDGALALVQASGLLEDIDESDDGNTATCTVRRVGRTKAVVQSFSMDDARAAGLLTKDGPWKTYPRRMRQMRARSWAIRDAFPDVLKGLHIAEEAQDIPVAAAPSVGAQPLTAAMLAHQAGETIEQADQVSDARDMVEDAEIEDIAEQQDDAQPIYDRMLDGVAERQASEAQQTLDDIDGPLDAEQAEDDGPDPREAIVDRIIREVDKCATVIDLQQLRSREAPHIDALPDEMAAKVKRAFKAMQAALQGMAG